MYERANTFLRSAEGEVSSFGETIADWWTNTGVHSVGSVFIQRLDVMRVGGGVAAEVVTELNPGVGSWGAFRAFLAKTDPGSPRALNSRSRRVAIPPELPAKIHHFSYYKFWAKVWLKFSLLQGLRRFVWSESVCWDWYCCSLKANTPNFMK